MTCPNHPAKAARVHGVCGTCYAREQRKNPEFRAKANESTKRYAAKPGNQERRSVWRKQWARNTRLRVLKHYSGKNKPDCACCGIDFYEFLAIDHINGGGLKHRREMHSQIGLYRWLITNGFPEGFRVLCHNCNLARGFYGFCPHEKEKA